MSIPTPDHNVPRDNQQTEAAGTPQWANTLGMKLETITAQLKAATERADALRRECERLGTCCKEQELTASQLVEENQLLRRKNAAYEERHQ